MASVVHWSKIGNVQLKDNWHRGQASSPDGVVRQIFNGTCLGMLGLTGFECQFPRSQGRHDSANLMIRHSCIYITHQDRKAASCPQKFTYTRHHLQYTHYDSRSGGCPIGHHSTRGQYLECSSSDCKIFSSLHWCIQFKPLVQITVSRSLDEVMDCHRRIHRPIWRSPHWSVPPFFRIIYWLNLFYCKGILSACELLEQLAHDRVIPRLFLKPFPVTGSLYVSVLMFMAFSGLLYGSAGANLVVISQM